MNGMELYQEAKKLIPGGGQLLSKRPEMYDPLEYPCYYKSAKGCEITTLDNKKLYDVFLMGIGTCLLGYSNPVINKAVIEGIKKGNMTTLNCPEEVELAKMLCGPDEMVRFARTGGEAMTIAVRIARAYNKRDGILFTGYHGWHDWYLSANLANRNNLSDKLRPGLLPYGIPNGLFNTSKPLEINNIEQLKKECNKEISCIVLEGIRNVQYTQEWLDEIKKQCKKHKIILIVDEITSGFRFGSYNTIEMGHIRVYGKALGNGHPITAVVGNDKIMDASQDTFISSTYWTERTGFIAAIATLKELQKQNYNLLYKYGGRIKDAWTNSAKKYGIKIEINGFNPMLVFKFQDNTAIYKTYYHRLMLKEGFLAGCNYYASFSHSDKIINKYCKAIDKVFKQLSELDIKNIDKNTLCHLDVRKI